MLTSNFVDILEWETKGFVCRSLWGKDGVKSFEEGLAAGVSFFPFYRPSFVPGHFFCGLNHVVTMSSRDWHKCYNLGIVSDLLDVVGDFSLDFLKTFLKYENMLAVKQGTSLVL